MFPMPLLRFAAILTLLLVYACGRRIWWSHKLSIRMPQPNSPTDVSALNIYQPPEFFANPNINITPLLSPPRIQALDLPNYQMFKQRLADEHGFEYLLAYTPLFQLGERGQDYMDAELDFGFIQNMYDDGCTKGNLLAYMLWVQTFSNMPTGEFSQQYGVVTQPNSGGTDPKLSVRRS